ncbi:hypothetical protein H9P43_003001 [Blastocladiella emersonii ATCC 22665]|nr:hypothetical protein H9P43_003001 [Blastocladiella emersonii ATCC 22665]
MVRRLLANGPLLVQEPRSRFRLAGAKWRLYYGVLEVGVPYLSLYPSNDTSDPRKCVARINFSDEASARVRDGDASVGGAFGTSPTRAAHGGTIIQLLNVAVTKDPLAPRPTSKPAKVLEIDAHSPESLRMWVNAIKAMLAWLKHGTEPALNLISSSFTNYPAAAAGATIPSAGVGLAPPAPSNGNRSRTNSATSSIHTPTIASAAEGASVYTTGYYGGDSGAAGTSMYGGRSAAGSEYAGSNFRYPALQSGPRSVGGGPRRPSLSDAGSIVSGHHRAPPSPPLSPTHSSTGSLVPRAAPTAPMALIAPSGGMRDRPPPIPAPQSRHHHHDEMDEYDSGRGRSRGDTSDSGVDLPRRTRTKSLFVPTPQGSTRLAIGAGGGYDEDSGDLLPSPTHLSMSSRNHALGYTSSPSVGRSPANAAPRSRSVGPAPGTPRMMPSRIEDLVAALPTSTSNRALPRPTSIFGASPVSAPRSPTSASHTGGYTRSPSGSRPFSIMSQASSAGTIDTSASAPAYLGSNGRRRKSVMAAQMDNLLDDLDLVLQSMGDAPDVPPIPPVPSLPSHKSPLRWGSTGPPSPAAAGTGSPAPSVKTPRVGAPSAAS